MPTLQLPNPFPLGQWPGDAPRTIGPPDDCHNIVLQFNNITQWLCYEDFLALEWNVRGIDINAFFDAHPCEDRIHLTTPSPYLNFSFRAGEMQELKQLLSKAVARIHWHETLKKAIN